MSSKQPLMQRLALRYPIIQAPMAGVATPALAAAVSNIGGLGSLGVGAMSAAQVKAVIKETRHLTSHPISVNVFCHEPARRNDEVEQAWLHHLTPLFAKMNAQPPAFLEEIYPSFRTGSDVLQVLLEERPEVVSFHFGLPTSEQLSSLRNAGIYTMATATNLQEAKQIQDAGIDAVIAQGIEAGGHRGMFDPNAVDECLSTFMLVRLLAKTCRLPVVAAGGIMDGHGIRAVLELGASAAQLGTAFLLCPESACSPAYRTQLKSERAAQTCLTNTISGRPARGIVNEFITFTKSSGSPPPPDYAVAYDAAKQLHAAAAKLGNCECAAHWAGQGAPLARELPVHELIEQLVKEARLPRG